MNLSPPKMCSETYMQLSHWQHSLSFKEMVLLQSPFSDIVKNSQSKTHKQVLTPPKLNY